MEPAGWPGTKQPPKESWQQGEVQPSAARHVGLFVAAHDDGHLHPGMAK